MVTVVSGNREATNRLPPVSDGRNDLRRQVNELRSDLLAAREKRTVRRQESSAIVTAIGGVWVYATFRAIASAAGAGLTPPPAACAPLGSRYSDCGDRWGS